MIILLSVGLLLGICFFLFLKWQFGTYSVTEVLNKLEEKSNLEKKYDLKFQKRDNLLYHISWAKSRGDLDDAVAMSKDLEELDKEIDIIENDLKLCLGLPDNTLKGDKAL
mmetsp:Transcript_15768/g.15917  ORF Transcript_15768/g.15917 Transcript_15768/m.15917 type:complete len:110 (+) Transcript_15768:246-575(+)